jgi:RNA polymerase sigma-70 factor (ECF subfamily)
LDAPAAPRQHLLDAIPRLRRYARTLAFDAADGNPGTDVGLRLDLQAALARLAPEQREALLLVCVEQFSYAEVAHVMRTPVGTVMSRVCRARAALRRVV